LGWFAISGKGASVTLDTKGLLLEGEELGVVFEAEPWGVAFVDPTGDEEGEEATLVLTPATERRPELSCASAKFMPITKAVRRSVRRYMKKP